MIGCDIIEISRVAASVERFGTRFLTKIMTRAEIDIYNAKGKKAEFAAGRFAAKEAVSKALGTGLGRGLALTDMEILPDVLGRPRLRLKGEERKDISVSISHSRSAAIAVCFIKEGV